jgi:hypothetical protein
MKPKQKTAIAALVAAAIVAISAVILPGVNCEPNPQIVEDALGGESSSGAAPDLGSAVPPIASSLEGTGGSSST